MSVPFSSAKDIALASTGGIFPVNLTSFYRDIGWLSSFMAAFGTVMIVQKDSAGLDLVRNFGMPSLMETLHEIAQMKQPLSPWDGGFSLSGRVKFTRMSSAFFPGCAIVRSRREKELPLLPGSSFD